MRMRKQGCSSFVERTPSAGKNATRNFCTRLSTVFSIRTSFRHRFSAAFFFLLFPRDRFPLPAKPSILRRSPRVFSYPLQERLDDLGMKHFPLMERQNESFLSPLIYPVTPFAPNRRKPRFEQQLFRLVRRQPWPLRQLRPPGMSSIFLCSGNPSSPLETMSPDRDLWLLLCSPKPHQTSRLDYDIP